MRPLLVVAEKEFRDHITSKRFVVIFGIMLLLSIYAINSGMDNYNQQLDRYKNPEHSPDFMYRQQQIDSIQKSIQYARENNQSPEYIQMLQGQLDTYLNPPMPSVLQVFQSMLYLFMFLGMVLGASLGFDQIVREKDEGSLKFLVSSPIYRDAIINGKTIGSITALAAAMAAAFAITIAIMMVKGIVPGVEDLIRIFLFFIASLVYCTVFFALAMMISAFSKNTAVAAIMTVGLVFVIFIYTVLASIISIWLAGFIVGPAPPAEYNYPPIAITNESVNGTIPQQYTPFEETESYRYNQRLWKTQSQISDLLGTLSPLNSYAFSSMEGGRGIGYALITKEYATFSHGGLYGPGITTRESSLLDALASSWLKLLALLVEIAAAFGIAYVAFMRMDIR